ncbi:MAG: hypothetical protein ABIC04_04760 [Nanoarchaeota archaeon]
MKKQMLLIGFLCLILAIMVFADSDSLSATLTVTSATPTIKVEPLLAVTLNQGTTKNISVYFNVTDPNGADDLNDTTAQATLTKSGEQARQSSLQCGQIGESGIKIQYNCSVSIQYFDAAGFWDVNVTIKTNAGSLYVNDTTQITLNSLDAVVINDTSIGFGSLAVDSTDNLGDVVKIINQGNSIYAQINITGFDLNGDDVATEVISANNFEAVTSTAPNTGTSLTNSTSVEVSGAALVKGASANEELYFYVDVPSGLLAQQYTSIADWIIETK